MEDRSYDQYDEPTRTPTSYGKWALALIGVIIIMVSIYFTVAFPLIDTEIYSILLVMTIIPMACFGMYIVCAWACGRPLGQTDLNQDARIFQEMRLRASRAEPIDGIDWYRCPNCKEAFEMSNAKPVDEKVVLCPFCDSRLIIG